MLSGYEIERRMHVNPLQKLFGKKPDIVITPFDPECVNPNSYDIHLSDRILMSTVATMDPKRENHTKEIIIPEKGLLIYQNQFYSGSTIEWTEVRNLVPMITGKSSVGQLGLQIHASADLGDNGFCGTWTFHLMCKKPTMLYPGMKIAQIYFELIQGKRKLYNGHYQNRCGATTSRMYAADNWKDQGR